MAGSPRRTGTKIISRRHSLVVERKTVIDKGSAQAVLDYALNNRLRLEMIEVRTAADGFNQTVTWGTF